MRRGQETKPAGTGRGNKPNRTEPDQATTRPKNQAEMRRTGTCIFPKRTDPRMSHSIS